MEKSIMKTYCPHCEKENSLQFIESISTWTDKKFICRNPKCRKGVSVKTVAGKVAQVSPLILAGSIAIKALIGELDTEDIANLIE